MSGAGFILLFLIGAMVLAVPRRMAALPLLFGAAYLPGVTQIDLGPIHFTAIRLLILLGCLRVLSKNERIKGRLNRVDKLVIAWAGWLVCSSVFHDSSVWITRLGLVFDAVGAYFLFRVFVREMEDVLNIFKFACVLFVALAIEMTLEKSAGRNYFAVLGGTSEYVLFRHGHFRAKGPFGHPILAGTVGALCLPMALYIWREDRKLALVGLIATGGVILASSSSGPVMTVMSIVGAMALWRVRGHLRKIRWLVVCMIVVLNFIMQDPVYYLIARIDISGGSTGFYRAALIRSALEHFGEWWAVGTDSTRGWMHVSVSEKQSDITNHFIQMGVWGGLPLMFLFMGILAAGFASIGRALRLNEDESFERQFLIWTVGAILFGHTTTFLSVSYFDQTVIFLYLIMATAASLPAMQLSAENAEESAEEQPAEDPLTGTVTAHA